MAAQPAADPNQGMYHLLASLPFDVRTRVWQQAMMEAGPGRQPSEAMIDSLVTSYNRQREQEAEAAAQAKTAKK
jgi:hypothetical protein